MESVIHGTGLSQRYWRRWVFRRLDIDVGKGVTALLGPNGAGKTTLLHTLVGLRPPVSGSLRVLGIDTLQRSGRRDVAARLGFLPQNVGIIPGYTLSDYITYAAWLKGVPNRELPALVNAALTKVDLAERAKSKMRTLSGGMIRRAGIAQALVSRPELLVLDEPAAGLDPEQRISLRRLMRTLAESMCVLISTHAVEDVRHVADHVLVLRAGEIVFDGSVTALEASRIEGVEGDTSLEQGYLTALSRVAGTGQQ